MTWTDEDDVRLANRDTGAIVLAWNPYKRRSRGTAQNVAQNELAHQLDLEDGVTNGVPELDNDEAYEDWA